MHQHAFQVTIQKKNLKSFLQLCSVQKDRICHAPWHICHLCECMCEERTCELVQRKYGTSYTLFHVLPLSKKCCNNMAAINELRRNETDGGSERKAEKMISSRSLVLLARDSSTSRKIYLPLLESRDSTLHFRCENRFTIRLLTYSTYCRGLPGIQAKGGVPTIRWCQEQCLISDSVTWLCLTRPLSGLGEAWVFTWMIKLSTIFFSLSLSFHLFLIKLRLHFRCRRNLSSCLNDFFRRNHLIIICSWADWGVE